MEETLAFPKMEEIDLINCLERISSQIPNKMLKLKDYLLKKNKKEQFRNNYFQRFQ